MLSQANYQVISGGNTGQQALTVNTIPSLNFSTATLRVTSFRSLKRSGKTPDVLFFLSPLLLDQEVERAHKLTARKKGDHWFGEVAGRGYGSLLRTKLSPKF